MKKNLITKIYNSSKKVHQKDNKFTEEKREDMTPNDYAHIARSVTSAECIKKMRTGQFRDTEGINLETE